MRLIKSMMNEYILRLISVLLSDQVEAFTTPSVSLSTSQRVPHVVALPSLDMTPPKRSSTKLSAILDPSILSQDSIHEAFTVATFFPQPFWLLLILIPNTTVTKKIMGGMGAS